MPRMPILTPTEYAAFETPPLFSSVERKRFFDLSHRLESLLTTFRTPTNAICFVLTLGYFKATKRFFARQFHATDAAYVARQLGYLPGVFDPSDYKEATARWHRTLILEHLGFLPCDEAAKHHLLHEIRPLIRAHVRPKVICLHGLDVLVRRKTERPNARTLTELIIGETRRHRGTLTEVINAHVPPELRTLLEALLEKADASAVLTPQFQRFKLTLLKQISQSAKPSRIASTLEDWQTLRLLYEELAPVIASLDLTHEGIRYYANAVLQSQVFQVARRADDDRHLHLVCFIAHQFYRLQDTLMDILLKVVQNVLNAGKRHHKEAYYAARTAVLRAVQAFVTCVDHGAVSPLQTIEAIAFNTALSDSEKVQHIQAVLTDGRAQRHAAQEQLVSFKTSTQDESDTEYYQALATQSRKLQNRVAEIVKAVAFQGDDTSDLMAAIQHYKAKDGQITQTTPLDFLEPQEQQAVLDDTGAVRVSLYKALLFLKSAEALKGGGLNLRHSSKYRSLDDSLMPQAVWPAQRDASLQRVDLTAVANGPATLHTLAARLDQQYHQTNQHILAGANPHVHFRKDGTFHVRTPPLEPEDSAPLLGLLPKRCFISLVEVLATVQRFTRFLEAFVPWRVQYVRPKPADRVFYAGITGYGCFIGTRKIASIASGISESELESTVNSYLAQTQH